MRLWAHAANTVGEQRHFFHRPPDAKTLEAAQFRDLEIGISDFPALIQENVDFAVSLQARDWVNGDSLHDILPYGA